MTKPEQLTWIAKIDDVIRDMPSDGGDGTRQVTNGDQIQLSELYFAAYPRTVVAHLKAAQHEFSLTFAGEYGCLDLDRSMVIERQNKIVAAVLIVKEAPWSDTPSGPFIIEVIVHPAYRRQGLARRCLMASAVALSLAGQNTIALRVMSDNKIAKKLYQGLGFSHWRGVNKIRDMV